MVHLNQWCEQETHLVPTLSEQVSSSGPPPITKSFPAQLATAGELTACFIGATSVQRLEKES